MNKCSSIFGQILSLIPRIEFERIVQETKSEKGAKGFSCWEQFVGMLFCQIGQACTLREITQGLASVMGRLRHLGMKQAPKRSTLAYANEHRTWQLYPKLFYLLLRRYQGEFQGTKKFRFKNQLVSFDATVIDLCATLFDWANFRRTKGAVKLHLVLDHEGYLPTFACITEGKVHEVSVLRSLRFRPGSIVVMDRGCVDYQMLGEWNEDGIYFVTRLKSNAAYGVLEKRKVPQNRGILKDEIITLTGPFTQTYYPEPLRRLEVEHPETREIIVLITNHLQFGATTLAAIYKDRWQIEIFFKTLKQQLRVKSFVGTTANALKIQIWTALIALLLLKYLKLRSTQGWSFSNLVALLRFNLFAYRDLWDWLQDPFVPPPDPDIQVQQLALGFI
jgi:hypothetical protein